MGKTLNNQIQGHNIFVLLESVLQGSLQIFPLHILTMKQIGDYLTSETGLMLFKQFFDYFDVFVEGHYTGPRRL